MTPCKFGESRHYGPCCFIHAEERPLLECIAALEASNRELREAIQTYLEGLPQIERETVECGELEAALARREG